MKITVEIELEDDATTHPAKVARLSTVLHCIFGYVIGWAQAATCKAGRVEVHHTGVFGVFYKDAKNVKITIDRT